MKSAGKFALVILLALCVVTPASAAPVPELRGRLLDISVEYGFAFINLGVPTGVNIGDLFLVTGADGTPLARVRVSKVYNDFCEGDVVEKFQPHLLRSGLSAVRETADRQTQPAPVTPDPPVTPAPPVTPVRPVPPAVSAAQVVATLHKTLARPGIVEHPLAVTVNADRKIYFLDTRHHAVMLWQDINAAPVVLPTAPAATLGGGYYFGSGPGQFACPSAIASDTAGLLYVADAFNNRVQVLDRAGRVLRLAGDEGLPLNRPAGLAVHSGSGTLYVAETGSGRIRQFAANGAPGRIFSARDGSFRPYGLAVIQEHLYAADGAGRRIVVFNRAGDEVASFGAGLLVAPRGVAGNGGDLLFVADPGAGCVFIYNAGGVLQGRIAGPELNRPFDVAWHPEGKLVVADPATNALLLYSVARATAAARTAVSAPVPAVRQ